MARPGSDPGRAVVLVAAPVVANAALHGDRTAPVPGVSVDPTTPPTQSPSQTPPATATTTPTPTASASQPAPDGRISQQQLLAARLDLPAWPTGSPSGCVTSRVRLGAPPSGQAGDGPHLITLDHGDVDADGATETVALIGCRAGEVIRKQVVAFDRDEADPIVTVGRVTRTNSGFDDILGVQVTSGGAVEVRVADIQPCCSTPSYLVREQTRTYRWNGTGFAQTGGPHVVGHRSAADRPQGVGEDDARAGQP
ncbi:hypothetical protein V6U81_19990 [Micromonospora sp. CPCC 205711]|uniref:hypothetical protein n=1 Tax=Micromonospora sp. CPCC 205547 TaxID=3122400 RepID=UPI002FF0E71B